MSGKSARIQDTKDGLIVGDMFELNDVKTIYITVKVSMHDRFYEKCLWNESFKK